MNLQVALERLAKHPLPVVAGGTDFYPALMDKPAPSELIDITQFDELKTIDSSDAGWRIGAAVTWTDLIRANLPPAFAALKAAAKEVGSVQIQNRATLVGNLCNASPAADGVPALLALNASVELCSAAKVRTLPLNEFITGVRTTSRRADELITAIHIPRMGSTEKSTFVKLGARKYLVISIAMLAVNLDFDESGNCCNCAIAVGSCSPVARRLTQLEQALTGMAIDNTDEFARLIAAAPLEELSPIDDVRGSAEYRMSVVRSVTQRAVRSVVDESMSLRHG